MESAVTPINLRDYWGFHKSYALINREERNYAALLYHLFMLGDNVRRFLEYTQYPWRDSFDLGEMGIYLEYAMLRDLWRWLDASEQDVAARNAKKRNFLLDFLQPAERPRLEQMSVEAFNRFFGASNPSSQNIQQPATWSLNNALQQGGMADPKTEPDEERFLKYCKLKWGFNIKPDIVIQTQEDAVLSMNCYTDATDGNYPRNKADREVFEHRFGRDFPQITSWAVERFLLHEVLGLKAQFLSIQRERSADQQETAEGFTVLLWKEAFQAMDTSHAHMFIQMMVEKIKQE
jgi:hypothetical protein